MVFWLLFSNDIYFFNILCCFVRLQMFGFLLGFSYLSFVELLNAQRSSIIQNLKDEDIFEISSYKRTMHWTGCIF